MKKLIIFGITAFSRLIRSIVEEDTDRMITAFCVNRDYLPAVPMVDQVPVVAFEDLDTLFGKDTFEVLITSGYAKMNENRKRAFRQCDEKGYAIASFVHSTVRCGADSMGRGNIVMQDCILHKFTKLGDGNILVDNTVIGHETEIGDFNFFAGITTGGLVKIGNHCFLGMKSIVCNDCTVSDYTLLGAGTVLSSNSEAHTVIMPARNRSIKMDVDAMANLLI